MTFIDKYSNIDTTIKNKYNNYATVFVLQTKLLDSVVLYLIDIYWTCFIVAGRRTSGEPSRPCGYVGRETGFGPELRGKLAQNIGGRERADGSVSRRLEIFGFGGGGGVEVIYHQPLG